MPPKAKITRDMITDCAFALVREKGEEFVTAREVAAKLNCSTQPVLYYFSTVDEIKGEAYKMCEEFHSEYILNVNGYNCNPLLAIALRYIKFAMEEKNLFRFLIQSKKFEHFGLDSLLSGEDIKPLLKVLRRGADADEYQAEQIFSVLFLIVHGYASMLANDSMEYNEQHIVKILKEAFYGVIYSVKSGVV